MDGETLRLLLVDDEQSLRLPLSEYFKGQFGFTVDMAANGGEAMRCVDACHGNYDVALIDQMLVPEPDGIQLMRLIKERYPAIECIILTGWGSEHRRQALKDGAFRYIEKPFDRTELVMLVRSAALQLRLRKASKAILSQDSLDSILTQLTAAAKALALADAVVLILAEPRNGEPHYCVCGDELTEEIIASLQESQLTQELLRSGAGVSIPKISPDDPKTPSEWERGTQSLVGVPIRGENRPAGVVYAFSRRQNHFDTWGSASILQILADQASLAIAHAAAFQQLQAQATYMESLVRVGQELIRSTDAGVQREVAWSYVCGQLHVSTFLIARYDRAADSLSFPLFIDGGERQTIEPFRLGEDHAQWGITGYVVKTGQELLWQTQQERKEGCARLGINARLVGRTSESSFYFPLRLGAETIGAISVQSYTANAFSPTLLDACRALGNQLVAAMENNRLLADTQQKADDLSVLHQLVQTITSSLDLERVMAQLCETAVTFFQADHCGLVMFDDELTRGTVKAEYPLALGALNTVIPLQGVAAEEQLALYRRYVNIFDVAEDGALGPVQETLQGLGIQSILIVPVIFQGRVLGSFSLDSIKQKRQFSEREIQLCQLFASQVAVAIANARSYAESERRGKLLTALEAASRHIRAEKDPKKLMHEIVRLAVDLMQCNAGALCINMPYQHHLQISVVKDLPAEMIGRRIPHGRSLVGKVAMSGQIDHEVCGPERATSGDSPHEPGYCMEIAVPLKQGANVEAVLWLASTLEEQTFSQAEQDILRRFAAQAAIALQTSMAMTAEQRSVLQLQILRQISDYVQAAGDIEKILHISLTGVTAGYGLGFNRAALLLVSADGRYLEGMMGIGHLREQDALADWAGDNDNWEDAFRNYIAQLEKQPLPPTPLDATVRSLRIPIDEDAQDVLSQIVQSQVIQPLTELDLLPNTVMEALAPDLPLVIAPLVAHQRTIGVLIVDNKFTLSPITDESLTALATFVNTAAIAIDNARLYQDAKDGLVQLERIKKAAGVIAGVAIQQDLQRTLHTIARNTREVLEADAVTLYAYDESGEHNHRLTEWGADVWQQRNPDSVRSADQLSMGSVAYKLVTGDSATWYYSADDPGTSLSTGQGHFIELEEIRTSMGVQLRANQHRVGVMFINYRSSHRFSDEEEATIRLFADQAAIAVRNTQLFNEVSGIARQNDYLYQQAKLVAKLTRQAAANLELGAFLESLFSSLVEIYQERKIHIYPSLAVYDKATEMLETYATRFYPTEERPNRRSIKRQSIRSWVARNMKSRTSSNVLEDKQYWKLLEATRSEIAVPVLLQGELYGVLDLESPQLEAFTLRDRDFLEMLAEQIAATARNVRLYDELQRTKTQMAARTSVAWVGMVSAQWRHQLAADVTTIRDLTTLLQLDLKQGSITRIGERVSLIGRLCDRIIESHITAPLDPESSVESLSLAKLVRERHEQNLRRERYRGIEQQLECTLSDSVTVRANSNWLMRGLDLLIDNAVQAMNDSLPKRLVLQIRRENDMAVVIVQDSGPGIPPGVREQLLQQPIRKEKGERGMGVGLLLVQMIMQTYKGDVHVYASGPGGTQIGLRLPIEPLQNEQ